MDDSDHVCGPTLLVARIEESTKTLTSQPSGAIIDLLGMTDIVQPANTSVVWNPVGNDEEKGEGTVGLCMPTSNLSYHSRQICSFLGLDTISQRVFGNLSSQNRLGSAKLQTTNLFGN